MSKYLFLKNPPPEMPLFTPKLAHVVNIKNTTGSKNCNNDVTKKCKPNSIHVGTNY